MVLQVYFVTTAFEGLYDFCVIDFTEDHPIGSEPLRPKRSNRRKGMALAVDDKASLVPETPDGCSKGIISILSSSSPLLYSAHNGLLETHKL